MNTLTPKETPAPAQTRRTVIPRYEVNETETAFVVTALVPGVERSELETHVDGENLTVSARPSWTPPADWTPLYREIPATDYQLVLRLDNRINREAVQAHLSQGVLTLTLAKSEAVKPRKIEIAG